MEEDRNIDQPTTMAISRDEILQIESNVFVPYRALGLFCDSVPPVHTPHPSSFVDDHPGFITCALGMQLCVYTVRPLRLCFSLELFNQQIELMTADQHRFYAAFGDQVAIIKEDEVQKYLFIPNGGPKLLLSLTECLVVVDKSNALNVFDVQDGQVLVQLESTSSFEVTALMHPHTYLNKILLGSSDGRMRLWNLRAGKLVHEFPAIPCGGTEGDKENASVACCVLEQSTAVDVIAMGMADGQIHLRNIKFDKVLCTFRQRGPITAIAFRTDGVATMASANAEGAVALWDLDARLLIGQLGEAHRGSPVLWLHFLLGQPLLMSAGRDNRMAKWFFRNENALPELNTALEGHSAPATALKFCSDDLIVSASRDGHVRRFHARKVHGVKDFGLAREVRRGDLSQDRFLDVPLNPIAQIELSHGREAVWDNMVCRHEESPLVSTWSTRCMKRGTHLLYHERFAKNPLLLAAFASSAFVSNCGNLALIGYSSGHVDVFNMQSGKWRFSLEAWRRSPQAELQQMSKQERRRKAADDRAHEALVSGVVLDMLNRTGVTGAIDGCIHFWRFRHQQQPLLQSRIRLGSGVRLFRLQLSNCLLAVGLDSGEIGVVDVLCRRLARRFHHNACLDWSTDTHLTALEFSGDGKWLISADSLGYIKVWDLTSSTLLDVMQCGIPCVAMAYNECSNLLATCHQGQRGIYLWANKTLFLPEMPVFSKTADEMHKNLSAISLPGLAQIGVQNQQQKQMTGEEEENSKSHVEVEEEEAAAKATDEQSRKPKEEVDLSSTTTTTTSQEKMVTIDEETDDEEDGEERMQESNREEGRPGTSFEDFDCAQFVESDQLEPKLFTLSGLAASRWAGLPMLNLIRERNRPTEPPKKAKSAPFFLPTVDTPQGFLFDQDSLTKLKETAAAEEEQQERTLAVAKRQLMLGGMGTLHSKWLKLLMSASNNRELCTAFAQFKEMSLSALDFQIRSLCGAAELLQFVAMLVAVLETRRDFELVQSYLATFLNIHHEALWNSGGGNGKRRKEQQHAKQQIENGVTAEKEEEEQQQAANEQRRLTENLGKLLKLQKQAEDEVQPLFDQSLSLAEFVKSALI